jgi:hypothetical protein
MRIIHFLFFLIIPFGLLSPGSSLGLNKQISTPEYPKLIEQIEFQNIESSRIKQVFLEVFSQFESLHEYEVILVQKNLKSSTMQAQPQFSLKGVFTGDKKYRITIGEFVLDSKHTRIADLPDEVLAGWFAHELGHVVDYEKRSTAGMLIYGMRYVTSKKFKRNVEFEADSIAVEHGFHEELIATKSYLLRNQFLSEAYREKLLKYYMPIEGVEMCVEENPPVEAGLNLRLNEAD